MERLTAGLVAEIACHSPSWSEVERVVVELLSRQVGADTAFFADRTGIGAHTLGVLAPFRDELNADWASLAPSVKPVFRASLETGGAIVDADFFGTEFRRVYYYERVMRPVNGTCTLMAFLARNGRLIQKIGLGRVRGSRPFTERDRTFLAALVPTLTLACVAASRMPPPVATDSAARFAQLTARERQVVSYLAQGYTNAQIGLALGTQPRTIRNQLSAAYEKLGVATRAEAVGLLGALGRGVLD